MSPAAGQAARPLYLGGRPGRALPNPIKLYDFRRPDKFSKEQMRTVQYLHEEFARAASTTLSAALRLPCELHLQVVDQMTYAEMMDPLPSPAILAMFAVPPLKGQIVAHLGTLGAGNALDRLFGAPVSSLGDGGTLRDGVTDIEWATLETLVSKLGAVLKPSLRSVVEVEPRLASVETESRYCQVVPPHEMVVTVGFSVTLGSATARLDLVYPFLTLEPLLGRLTAQYVYSKFKDREKQPTASVYRLPLPAEIVCGAGRPTIAELRALEPGSILPLPDLDRGKASLRLGGTIVADLAGLSIEGRRVSAGFEALSPVERLPGDSGDEGARQKTLADELREGLGAIKAGLESSMASVSRELAELRGKQEDLSDRVLYGQADAEAAVAPRKPFATLSIVPADALALFLGSERPQLIALVLAFMDDAQASAVLGLMPEAIRPEVVKRIATMDWAAPEVVATVDSVLGKKLSAIGKQRLDIGGVAKVVGILNTATRETERQVITSLDVSDPALAESIKRNMFVFEDIIILDDESIAAVLERADEKDILLAMKPVAESERVRILARFPADHRERLAAAFSAMGRVRLSECDAAGQRVVAVIRTLEEEGRIYVLREGE